MKKKLKKARKILDEVGREIQEEKPNTARRIINIAREVDREITYIKKKERIV